MMKRRATKSRTDKEVFKRTAASSKAINLGVRHYRGGTRL